MLYKLDKVFPAPGLAVAKVIGIRDGRLLWSPVVVATRSEHDIHRLVYKFLEIEIEDRSDDDILTFAQAFGPLGLCEKHGLPVCHGSSGEGDENPDLKSLHVAAAGIGANVCPPRMEEAGRDGSLPIYSEPIARWRAWSRHVRACLLLHDEIKKGQLGSPENWADMRVAPPKTWQEASVKLVGAYEIWRWAPDLRLRAGFDLGGDLRYWLISFTGTPHTTDDGLMIQAAGYLGGLFGYIGTHLLLAPAPGAGIARCDECRRVYFLNRKPKTEPDRSGRVPEHFCPGCRDRAKVAHMRKRQRNGECGN
jgi:hypothetical protein